MAFLGGSITFNPGWREQVGAFLVERFPRAEFTFVNGGIPSMGSTPGAFRLARDVLARGPIDLLFVEAAVNDATNGRSPLEMLRGMEGIVRHARRVDPSMDIVMLHFVDPDKLAVLRAGGRPEVIAVHERVAEHYGVPSLDLAREVTERIDAGEFSWEDDFEDLHPSPFGQALYARAIQRLLTAAWDECEGAESEVDETEVDETTVADPETREPREHGLPAPLDAHSYDAGALLPIERAVVPRGFRRVDAWKPNDGKGTRAGFVNVPMLVAEQPGAELSLAFEGRAVGILIAAGPDAGTIEFTVDDSPPRSVDLFTRWSGGLHLPWAHILAAELAPGRHELRLRVVADRNERSVGHAVRIVHLLVNR